MRVTFSTASAPKLPPASENALAWPRALLRLPFVVSHIALAMPLVLWIKLLGLVGVQSPSHVKFLIRYWERILLWLLGVRVTVQGQAPKKPVLLVANHISWVDAIVIGGYVDGRFLAKEDVAGWPILGALTKAGSSLFIKRGAHQTPRVIREVADCLSAGDNIIIFPEATTTWGNIVSYFFPRLFKAAKVADVPIMPMAVGYPNSETHYNVGPYTEKMTFVGHFLDLLQAKETKVNLQYLPSFSPNDLSRKAQASLARQRIAECLGLTASERQEDDIDFEWLFATLRRNDGAWQAQ